jgi:hypothetical protein
MILQGDFVDPVEWWDPHWHKDQMEGQWARSGAPQAEPAKAAKGKAKAAKGKKRR